jgi:hypothetical protein
MLPKRKMSVMLRVMGLLLAPLPRLRMLLLLVFVAMELLILVSNAKKI